MNEPGDGREVGEAREALDASAPSWRAKFLAIGPPGLLPGLLVAILVMVAGLVLARSPQQWTAHTELLMAPRLQDTEESKPAYYETLSHGQVAATAAAIAENPTLVRQAAQAVGVEDVTAVRVRVSVIPDTSLIRISTTAPSETAATELADELARVSVPEVNHLLTPYGLSRLGQSSQTAELAGLTPRQTIAVAALMALAVGVAVQQLIQQVVAARRRRRYPGG